jgi:hypothetical protein
LRADHAEDCGHLLCHLGVNSRAVPVCVRLAGPPRLSILERHARASSLGAPRRPVRAAGLTRVRLAPLDIYVDGRALCAVESCPSRFRARCLFPPPGKQTAVTEASGQILEDSFSGRLLRIPERPLVGSTTYLLEELA